MTKFSNEIFILMESSELKVLGLKMIGGNEVPVEEFQIKNNRIARMSCEIAKVA